MLQIAREQFDVLTHSIPSFHSPLLWQRAVILKHGLQSAAVPCARYSKTKTNLRFLLAGPSEHSIQQMTLQTATTAVWCPLELPTLHVFVYSNTHTTVASNHPALHVPWICVDSTLHSSPALNYWKQTYYQCFLFISCLSHIQRLSCSPYVFCSTLVSLKYFHVLSV